jgi:hypothetical protein
LPSAVRGTGFFAAEAAGSEDDATAFVPCTTTVTVRFSALLPGPVTESVYVVVADGLSVRSPRGATRPNGSSVTVVGFSTDQRSVADWPG